jgi:hypothetical protein
MKLNSALANTGWIASSLPEYVRFRRALSRPGQEQNQFLLQMLSRGAFTSYGAKYGFSEIKSYEEFAGRVPIVTYDDLEVWIARIMRGEKSVLTTDPVSHLVPTSGSTSARKLIPFTPGLQADFNRAICPWIVDLYHQFPTLALGRAYWSITPPAVSADFPQSNVPIGFDSDTSYLGGMRQDLVDSIMAVPSSIQLISDIDAFHYVTLLHLLQCPDLRLISVWHPSFLSLLLKELPTNWNKLLRDIKKGGCAIPFAHPAKSQLRLFPNPRLARQLAALNPHQPALIWPKLKLISCWAHGHSQLAASELDPLFPGVHLQPKGLLATEGVVSIPFQGAHPLAIRSHFFEFLDARGKIHLAHELEPKKTYEVILSTFGGLWRYTLRDIIQVTGFLENTPSVRFIAKCDGISDLFGEKLSEAFVSSAVQRLISTLVSPLPFALLAPEQDQLGWRYTLFVDGSVPDRAVEMLDGFLRENPQYDYCRALGQLQPLRISRVENGYETFLRHEMDSGRRLGDIKSISLSTARDWSTYFCLNTPAAR